MNINLQGYELGPTTTAAVEKIVDRQLLGVGNNIATGGAAGQYYRKNSLTNFDASWVDLPAVSSSSGNIDGGTPFSLYGGTSGLNGGTP